MFIFKKILQKKQQRPLWRADEDRPKASHRFCCCWTVTGLAPWTHLSYHFNFDNGDDNNGDDDGNGDNHYGDNDDNGQHHLYCHCLASIALPDHFQVAVGKVTFLEIEIYTNNWKLQKVYINQFFIRKHVGHSPKHWGQVRFCLISSTPAEALSFQSRGFIYLCLLFSAICSSLCGPSSYQTQIHLWFTSCSCSAGEKSCIQASSRARPGWQRCTFGCPTWNLS